MGQCKLRLPVGYFKLRFSITLYKLKLSTVCLKSKHPIGAYETRLSIGCFKSRVPIGSHEICQNLDTNIFSCCAVIVFLPPDKTAISLFFLLFSFCQSKVCLMEHSFLLIKTRKMDKKVKKAVAPSLNCSLFLFGCCFSPKWPNDCLPAD